MTPLRTFILGTLIYLVVALLMNKMFLAGIHWSGAPVVGAVLALLAWWRSKRVIV